MELMLRGLGGPTHHDYYHLPIYVTGQLCSAATAAAAINKHNAVHGRGLCCYTGMHAKFYSQNTYALTLSCPYTPPLHPKRS